MLVSYKGVNPEIKHNTFIAPNSTIIGKCFIDEDCSIWYNAVLRADVNEIKVGRNSNIQDGCVVHCDTNYPTTIGENVTIGHLAIIHGCEIGNFCLIGMGSTILDGAVIGNNVIVGANSLVTSGKVIPDNSLVIGSPAKVVRPLTTEEIDGIRQSVNGYVHLSKDYL